MAEEKTKARRARATSSYVALKILTLEGGIKTAMLSPSYERRKTLLGWAQRNGSAGELWELRFRDNMLVEVTPLVLGSGA